MSTPKTRASRWKVFLSGAVLGALQSIQPAYVQSRVLEPACMKAGFARVTWHHFRYTYSTWAEPTGESIKAFQAQLGHTDSRLTLGVYTQPMPEAQAKIASKVANVLLPLAPKFDSVTETAGAMIQ